MYESFYKLRADAFRISPDNRFFFEHAGYMKARAYLSYAFQRSEGFVVVTGRPGTGKTTLVNDLIASLPNGKVVAAHLVVAKLISDDLLKAIAYQFDLDVTRAGSADLVEGLTALFTQLRSEGRRALIIVDEAHALSVSALEDLRLLTNLQERGQPLVQIFLIGQPELQQKLRLPELEQAHQRIVAACNLEPLDLDELEAYIFSRLKTVGWAGKPTFDPAVFPLILSRSEGIPRRINFICGRLMLKGSVEQLNKIEPSHVQEVIEELRAEGLYTPQDDAITSTAQAIAPAHGQAGSERPPQTETPPISNAEALSTPNTAWENLAAISRQGAFAKKDDASKPGKTPAPAEPVLEEDKAQAGETSAPAFEHAEVPPTETLAQSEPALKEGSAEPASAEDNANLPETAAGTATVLPEKDSERDGRETGAEAAVQKESADAVSLDNKSNLTQESDPSPRSDIERPTEDLQTEATPVSSATANALTDKPNAERAIDTAATSRVTLNSQSAGAATDTLTETGPETQTETSPQAAGTVASASAEKSSPGDVAQIAESGALPRSTSIKRELHAALNQTIEERLERAPETTWRSALSDNFRAFTKLLTTRPPRYLMPAAVIGLVLAAFFAFTVFGPKPASDQDNSIVDNTPEEAAANTRELSQASNEITQNEEIDQPLETPEQVSPSIPSEAASPMVSAEDAAEETDYFEELVALYDDQPEAAIDATPSETDLEKSSNTVDSMSSNGWVDTVETDTTAASNENTPIALDAPEPTTRAIENSNAQSTIERSDKNTALQSGTDIAGEMDSKSVPGPNLSGEPSNTKTAEVAPAKEIIEKVKVVNLEKAEKVAKAAKAQDLVEPADSPKVASTLATEKISTHEPASEAVAEVNLKPSVTRPSAKPAPLPMTAAPVAETPAAPEPDKDLKTSAASDELASVTSPQTEALRVAPAEPLEGNMEAPEALTGAALKEYQTQVNVFVNSLVTRVNRKIRYPKRAVQKGQEGKLELAVTLDLEGRLLDTRVVTSSGHRLLDKAALKAAKKALEKADKDSINSTVIAEFADLNTEKLIVPVPITFRMN